MPVFETVLAFDAGFAEVVVEVDALLAGEVTLFAVVECFVDEETLLAVAVVLLTVVEGLETACADFTCTGFLAVGATGFFAAGEEVLLLFETVFAPGFKALLDETGFAL